MKENEKINGWTFEETVKTAENLMEAESNMFKWDVLRHLRDFAESYKDELEQYRAIGTVEHIKLTFELCKGLDAMTKMFEAIGTIEEFKDLKEKAEPKKPQEISWGATNCPICGQEFGFNSHFNHCSNCGQKLDWQ